MSDGPGEFARLYQTTLAEYLHGGEEDQLEAAYRLGRDAFIQEMTVLELVDVHRSAVSAIMGSDPTMPDQVDAMFGFLAEALAMFHVARGGFQEAQERALRERERSVSRDRLAEAYITLERSVGLADRLRAIETVAADLVDARLARCYGLDQGEQQLPEAKPGHMAFPLRNPRGETVAVLDVDMSDHDRVPDDDRFLLEDFSHMAGIAVESARQFSHERSVALMLQHNLLPPELPAVPELDVAVRYLPGEAGTYAGGDWYDVFELDDDRVGLVVGDVSGHGVAAAAAMGQLRIAVLAYALAGFEPAGVVTRVDSLLERLGTGEIATLVYVVADPYDGQLVLVNAGHPPPVIVEPGGPTRALAGGHSRLLGLTPRQHAREQGLEQLPRHGHLLLYTDGLLDPLERTGVDAVALLHTVTEGFTGTADELSDLVLAELAPDGARDDICIVAATRTA